MCGRIALSDNADFAELFRSLGIVVDAARPPLRTGRYNIAPTQSVDVLRPDGHGALETVAMRWGFVMRVRGKTKPVDKTVFNARRDKLWSSPLWRRGIADHRVLVPVSGFYEWQRHGRKSVQAYWISPVGQGGMLLAALYRPGDAPQLSIVTTEANRAMSEIHARMPVILSANEAGSWLRDGDRASLEALMQPAPEQALAFTPVSDYVNTVGNQGPECIEPAPAQAPAKAIAPDRPAT